MNDTTDPILLEQDASASVSDIADTEVETLPDQEQAELAPQEPEAEVILNPRLARLEEKARSREQAEVETSVAAEPEPEVVQQPELPVHMGEDGRAYVRTKVDGEEGEVPLEKIVADYQKGVSSDQRLRNTVKKEQDLAARELKLQQREKHHLSSDADVQTAPSGQDVQTGADQADPLDTIREAVLYDNEDAQQKVRDMFGQKPQQEPAPAVDPIQVAQQVRDINDHERQVDEVRNDENYSDIFTDAAAMQELDQYSAVLIEQEPTLTVAENLRKAGDMYKMRTGQSIQKPSSEPELPTRRQAKQALSGQSVPASTQRAQVSSPTPKPQTRAEALAEMKRSRGLLA